MSTPQTAASHPSPETQWRSAGGTNIPDTGQTPCETHAMLAGIGDQTSATGTNIPDTGHIRRETQWRPAGLGDQTSAGGTNIPETGHVSGETQALPAGIGDQTSATGIDQSSGDAQASSVGAGRAILFDPTIYVLAENVTDLESTRKAVDNRLRQLTRCDADADGEVRGHCLPEDYPAVVALRVSSDLLAQAEKSAVKALERAMKDHPLGPWIQAQNGLGLKTMARLLGAIGDPYWHNTENRPVKVSELWSYCGLGDARRQVRRKGVKSNWSDEAKMRAWNCVQPIIKNTRSPYRAVYDAVKAGYQGAVHADECKRCGPAGKPAQPGSPLSKGHIDARAQRAVMKAILKDLWIESRRIHEEAASRHL